MAVARRDKVAPARLVASVGRDALGSEVLDLEHLHLSSQLTGIGLIGVDDYAHNTIIVAPSANGDLKPRHVTPEVFSGARVVCISLEILKITWREAIRSACAVGALVVVNASPSNAVQSGDLEGTDVLVVNRLEAVALGGAALTGAMHHQASRGHWFQTGGGSSVVAGCKILFGVARFIMKVTPSVTGFSLWWREPGMIRRHHDFQSCALPAELPRLAPLLVLPLMRPAVRRI